MIPKITGFGLTARRKLHYDYYGTYYGKNLPNPHSTAYGYSKRNLLQYGINCRSGNYLDTLHDFNRFSPKHHSKNKTINIILGFNNKEINCHKLSDRLKAIKLGIKFVNLSFGKNAQALISLQHDSHEPHLHITVNNVNIKTLKAIPSRQRNLSRLEAIDTDMIKENNKKYPNHKLINPFHHKFQTEIQHEKLNEKINVPESTKHSLAYRVRKALLAGLMNPKISSKSKLRKFMKNKYQIRVKFIRPNRHKNSHHRRRHNHYGIVMIPFIYTNKKHTKKKSKHSVKASGIGISYKSVIKQLNQNRKLLRQQQRQARSKAKAKRKAIAHKRKLAILNLKRAAKAINDDKDDPLWLADIDENDFLNLANAKAKAQKVLSNKEIQQITNSKPSIKPKSAKKPAPKPVNHKPKSKSYNTKHIEVMPTVSNTMIKLSVPTAQQDFGTELDMRYHKPPYIDLATKHIREHYHLRQQHARIINNYMNSANHYNAKHHVSIFKRAVHKAKSWLHRKHIQFKTWIKRITKPNQKNKSNDENYVGSPKWKRLVNSATKEDKESNHQSTKSDSDEESIIQQRAFNRNRLKRIKGDEWQK